MEDLVAKVLLLEYVLAEVVVKASLVDEVVHNLQRVATVDALVSALQDGPDTLNAVGGHIVPDPFASLVVDCLVFGPLIQVEITSVLVRKDERFLFDGEEDVRFERSCAI